MKVTQAEIEEILSILSETPVRISAAGNGLSNEQLNSKSDPNSWSANEILAHLRACVDVWVSDIDAMLEGDEPTLRYLSPRTWMRKTDYPELDFHLSFQLFKEQRSELLKKLSALEFDDWSRSVLIKDRHQTVFSHARRLAYHEQGHWEQLETIQ